jgi:mono/diheme cytochrome c family protein
MNRAGLLTLVFGCAGLSACSVLKEERPNDKYVPDGDPSLGLAIIASGAHGCAGCHAIPGVVVARGVAGPSLGGFARRAFIAGQLPNQPEVLIQFLQDPPALVTGTGMPDVRLSLKDARDIAAYLYTLEPSNVP